ncbi:hypothetical protein RhiirA4_471248 [Rhizophagus irregularis]|uniref:Uncharacterized protein n=1 Tax=Rhizophagus irregularis TaxID=588596 RepID=A0A2I1H2S6_9GLOM|nr:hypothetical protein RhiirA4_471248 [Rhizophagus irregularis]
MEKINRIKQISKNITIVGSTLSLTSSAISGGLLSGYSQEGGFLSLAGSATSGFFALIGSIVDNCFSIKEMDAQKSKVELEKKLETRLEEKFYRDRRSFRESWIELVDIYEDLYLLRHISKNFPVEVDEALSNFVEVLSKVNQVNYEQNDEENEKLTIKEESSNIVIEDTTRPYLELNSINIQRYTTMSGFTHRSLWENTSTKSDTVLQPVSQYKELLKKWKENGNNIAEKIKELVEKIDVYHKNQTRPYQYPSSKSQPTNQYPPLKSQPPLQSKLYQCPTLKPQPPLHSKPYQYPPLKPQLYQYPPLQSQPLYQYPY